MNRTIALFLFIAMAAILLSGCQESESSQFQRARMVASENLKLKQQLEQKDEQIASLQNQIEQLNTEHANALQESTEAYLAIVQTFTQTEQNNEALIKENQALKEELEKLKTQ